MLGPREQPQDVSTKVVSTKGNVGGEHIQKCFDRCLSMETRTSMGVFPSDRYKSGTGFMKPDTVDIEYLLMNF